MKVCSSGNLGLSREYPKKLLGPMYVILMVELSFGLGIFRRPYIGPGLGRWSYYVASPTINSFYNKKGKLSVTWG